MSDLIQSTTCYVLLVDCKIKFDNKFVYTIYAVHNLYPVEAKLFASEPLAGVIERTILQRNEVVSQICLYHG